MDATTKKVVKIYWFIATSRERFGFPSIKMSTASLTRALSSSIVSSYPNKLIYTMSKLSRKRTFGLLVVTRPRTTTLFSGRCFNGAKSPARSVSYSSF